eukprot:scaffold10998_cov130-Amphora_coffeaeformis.AAC.1
MAKKKKKSKGGDARGYGQTTVFRAEPTPKTAATTSDPTTTRDANAGDDGPPVTPVVDDWEAAMERDEKDMQVLLRKQAPPPPRKKIPPPADVKLPILLGNNNKSPSTVLLSAAMHDLLEDLVKTLPWQSFVAICDLENFRTDRHIKKIAYLYDYLLVAGFTWDHIRGAVECLGRANLSIDLDTTLDWLCHSLDSTELPLRFLDEREALTQSQLRQEEQQNAGKDASEPVDDQSEEVERQAKKVVRTEGTSYEPSNEQNSMTDGNNQNEMETQVETDDTSEAPIALEKTKDEERLEELEKAFAEVTSEYKDEASKYMLSKHEVKELETRYKQMKKEMDRLKIKVERARERKRAEELANENENDEGEEGPSFGGLFDDDSEPQMETTNSDNNPITTLPRIHVPNDAIPTSWTGKTPKEILEERCRNLKLPRPTFQNLGQHGCRVVIKGLAGLEVEERAIFDSKMDGHHYAATKALYKLDPTLPIHRSLPPFYRDLWKGWANEVQNAKDEQEKADEDKRKQDILELLSHVPEQDRVPKAVEDPENDDEP